MITQAAAVQLLCVDGSKGNNTINKETVRFVCVCVRVCESVCVCVCACVWVYVGERQRECGSVGDSVSHTSPLTQHIQHNMCDTYA